MKFKNAEINILPKNRILLWCLDFFLGSLGVIVLASEIPWSMLLSTTTPSGGDNPAHPVLMKSIGEAFFQHGTIIHYSPYFWSGFEAFQFYFPLPYLFGAGLSQIINPNVAFKITTIIGILGLPLAFYLMARAIGLYRISATLASLLSVVFLYTEAHVMWGGNIFSALAGMIGNSWAFIMFTLSFGRLIQCRDCGRFSILTTLLMVATALCHFYGFLMLLVLFGIFVFEDLATLVFKRTLSWSSCRGVYFIGLCAGLLICWWFLPLLHYQPFSSDFGGDWKVDLLSTLTLGEKITFGCSLVLAGIIFWIRRKQDKIIQIAILFFIACLLLYFSNHIAYSTAFINVRLWPSLYFSCFVLTIVVFDRLVKFVPIVAALVAVALSFLAPNAETFTKTKGWMTWNFSGVETKFAGNEFTAIIKALKKEPSSRVSFESSDSNNNDIGSVRTFELIPYLTNHQIVEGGIVNSATFPGMGYMLQCLTSNTCAGWPNGSIMPTKDFPRAIELMRMLGVQYHIAKKQENKTLIEATGAFEIIYQGKSFTLYKLKTEIPSVEVYDSPLPIITGRPHLTLLNLPRWDALREAGFIFDWKGQVPAISKQNQISPITLFNFLNNEWLAGHHGTDLGWEDRAKPHNGRFLNSFLISWKAPFDLSRELDEGFDFFIADRLFDTDISIVINQLGYTELLLPLLRDQAGTGLIDLHATGYEAYQGEKKLAINGPTEVQFSNFKLGQYEQPAAHIKFIPISSERYRNIDAKTEDITIRPGLPGPAEISTPANITESCSPRLEYEFHKLTLTTNCPGKPHIIKYSYYPKWKAEVPIEMGSNGYMTLTPNTQKTVIRHKIQAIDILGRIASTLGFIIVVLISCRTFRPKT